MADLSERLCCITETIASPCSIPAQRAAVHSAGWLPFAQKPPAADHALKNGCCGGTGLGLQGARTTFLQGAWHVATTPFRVLGYARDTASGVAQSAIEYTLHKANSYAQVNHGLGILGVT